jgi:cyanophycinase
MVRRFSHFILFLLCSSAIGVVAHGQRVGPRNGALVIHGGGSGAAEAFERFMKLAGGPNSQIVIIPTAAGDDNYEHFDHLVMRRLRGLGAVNLRVLHAKSRSEANSDEFAAVIAIARGIWFTGGRQWRLADTYVGTKAERAMHDLLDRGGVIGGGSAGATIQGSYLVRGDTRGAMVMMGDHELGFSFLKNVAIDQHLLSRNRQFDMVDLVRAHPDLLGIGLDENTAIVVKNDSFEVLGEGYVAIYDPEIISANGHFYFLSPGDRFDLATRIPYGPSTDPGEVWIPQIRSVLSITSQEMLSYAGRYTNGEVSIRIMEQDGRLIARKDDDAPVEIRPLSRNLFFDVYTGSRVTFSIDETGCAQRLRWLLDAGSLELRKMD